MSAFITYQAKNTIPKRSSHHRRASAGFVQKIRRAPRDGEKHGGSCLTPGTDRTGWKWRYASRGVEIHSGDNGSSGPTADSADHCSLIPRSQALPRLSVHFLLKRIDQSLIVCAHPKISIPGDRANLCWARSIVLLEHSELLSVPRRNKKFHCKGLSVSYRYESNSFMRGQFSGQSMSTRMDRHRSTLSESAFTAPLPSAEARSNGYGKRGEVVVRSGRRPLARMSIHNRVQFSASS